MEKTVDRLQTLWKNIIRYDAKHTERHNLGRGRYFSAAFSKEVIQTDGTGHFKELVKNFLGTLRCAFSSLSKKLVRNLVDW